MIVLSYIIQYLIVLIKRFKGYLFDLIAYKQATIPKIVEKYEIKCQKEINQIEKEIHVLNSVLNSLVENLGDL